jgi:methylated-DNA-[protein]-cysteine S-methyltransferase
MTSAPRSLASAWSAVIRAPFAMLGIRTEGGAVTKLAYLPPGTRALSAQDAAAARAVREIEHYLDDAAFVFSVPLAPRGTPFQRRVWDSIRAIPLRESRTYGEIARQVHSAPRAIGQACGANPIALIIPCHRVVGSGGTMGGFMGVEEGNPIAIKRWLLTHEGYRFGR